MKSEKPEKLPIRILAYVYPGTHRCWWDRHAKAGELGEITVEAGRQRNRMVQTATVESRFGTISERQYAEGLAAYEAARLVVRRIS